MFMSLRRQAETLPTLLSSFCYTESAAVILPLLLVKVLHSIAFLFFFLNIRNSITRVCSVFLHFLLLQ